MKESDVIAKLEDTKKYLVLNKVQRKRNFFEDNFSNKKVGLYLYAKYTGTNILYDNINEIGLVMFHFNSDGYIFDIIDEYEDKEDLSKNLTFSEEIIRRYCDQSILIVSHDSNVVRKLVEKRFKFFENKYWACSLNEIAWINEGIHAEALEHIAYKFKLYLCDDILDYCYAALSLLSMPLPISRKIAFKTLLINSRTPFYTIVAENTLYDSREILKKHQYQWSSERRVWYKTIDKSEYEKEKAFLTIQVYGVNREIPLLKVTSIDKFSFRGLQKKRTE